MVEYTERIMTEIASQLPLPWCSSSFDLHQGSGKNVVVSTVLGTYAHICRSADCSSRMARMMYNAYPVVQKIVRLLPLSACEGAPFQVRPRMADRDQPLRYSHPSPHCSLLCGQQLAGNPVVTVSKVGRAEDWLKMVDRNCRHQSGMAVV